MSQEKNALQAKAKLQSSFMKKGITVAILSGMCYGMYSAFLYVGTSNGIWADWYSGAIVLVVKEEAEKCGMYYVN